MRLHREEKLVKELPHLDVMLVIRKLKMMFWEKHSKTSHMPPVAASIWDRHCFNDTFQCILWAELLWKVELSDMLHCTQKVHGELQECQMMVHVLWIGKIDQKRVGAACLAQCFHHLDAEKCAIGAIAFHLFAWFRCTQEEFDFSNHDWFDVKTTLP